MHLEYSSLCLRLLRSAVTPLLGDDVVARVLSFGLRRKRGCRGGWQFRARARRTYEWSSYCRFNNIGSDDRGFNIPVIRTLTPPSSILGHALQLYRGVRDARSSALRSVLLLRDTPAVPCIKIGELNAHSVSNKSASICDWINDNGLHLAAVVETWHDGIDSPSLIACTPPGYRFVERARPRLDEQGTNHGGVCLFHVTTLHVRPVALPAYDTFEFLSVYVNGSGINTLTVVLYRPGSASITDNFFEDLSDLLERTSSYKSLLKMGDINIHLDKPSDAHTVKFQSVLSVFGLSQQVQSPTHQHGHLLDVLITRSDVNVRSLRVDPPMMSDHSTIVAELDLPLRQNFSVTRVARRCWRSFNLEDFVQDVDLSPLTQSPPSDITELFALYDTTLRSILDKHAPYRTVRVRDSVSAARWYNGHCRHVKAKTRHFEKIYRHTRTPASLSAWREHFAIQRKVFEQRFTSFWTNLYNQ
ncbi:MAG TPA: endonuclease/exonuclease/phosphatase family protein [Methylomicrobium sp.]|nr:endonuclease/exonuclease/phosphatase family protein [Methylomicrobium sp.]